MSKYIKQIPMASIERMAIVLGGGRLAGKVKADTGADLVCNAGFFGANGKPTHHLKAEGKVLAKANWGCWGYAWGGGADIKMEALPAEARRNYIAGVELLSPMVSDIGNIPYDPKGELGGKRGRTAMALGVGTLILYCSGDGTGDAATPEALQDQLYKLGAETAIMLDGGGSSQCDFGGGQVVRSSRAVHNYLCVWLRKDNKEDKPVGTQYKVSASIGLNIRNAPGGAKVGAYACGALVSILEVKDGWGLTSLGWVSMEHLEAVRPPQRSTDNGIAIQERILPHGANNRPGYANSCAYITIHETGNKAKGADAAAHAGYLDSAAGEKALVSWHYTVDDHAIVQHLPDTESGYHTGDGAKGPGNIGSIGIEICVNEGGDFEAAKRNAAALVRILMAEHKIPLANVVQHNHWSGKDCPATIRATPGGWAAFVALCEGKETKPGEDFREAVKTRFGFDGNTMDYLAAYKYGPDLLRKLATLG